MKALSYQKNNAEAVERYTLVLAPPKQNDSYY